jgi:hypothetical protein
MYHIETDTQACTDISQAVVADWGDNLEITVTNNLQHNGTGIHWHGVRQWNSNEQDGVNGITECPIAPGASKVYKFKATQYGTTVSFASGASYDVNVADRLSGITRTTPYSMAMVSLARSSSEDLRQPITTSTLVHCQ